MVIKAHGNRIEFYYFRLPLLHTINLLSEMAIAAQHL